jgi:fatty-acyl-CoA synthase
VRWPWPYVILIIKIPFKKEDKMKALEERRKDLMASYPVWKKMTLYQGLASKAAECPNHVFLLVEGRRYTYGEVLREADRISAAFGAMGLARGGCVAVALSNRIESHLPWQKPGQ